MTCRSPRTSAHSSNRFAQALSGHVYAHLREGGKKMLRQMPTVRELARRSEEHLKGMVLPGTLFEEMGFNYIGPVDGHDVKALVRTLRNLRKLRGPQFLHVRDPQGQGLRARPKPIRSPGTARVRSIRRAAPSSRRRAPARPIRRCSASGSATWPKRIRKSSASRRPCARARGWCEFSKRFPDRYFDVAIAEQHAVTFAAGLATEGAQARGGDLLHLPAARL